MKNLLLAFSPLLAVLALVAAANPVSATEPVTTAVASQINGQPDRRPPVLDDENVYDVAIACLKAQRPPGTGHIPVVFPFDMPPLSWDWECLLAVDSSGLSLYRRYANDYAVLDANLDVIRDQIAALESELDDIANSLGQSGITSHMRDMLLERQSAAERKINALKKELERGKQINFETASLILCHCIVNFN